MLLHHVFVEMNGKAGARSHAIGGMDAITQALATAARRLGAMFESDVPVRRILMERAFAHARLTGMSRAPIVEMLIRSTPDTSIAPKGAHVASLCCQHFPYKPPGSRNGHQVRARAARLNFSTVNSYAPNFRASDMGHSALSPMDLAEKPGLAAGDNSRGESGLAERWATRRC